MKGISNRAHEAVDVAGDGNQHTGSSILQACRPGPTQPPFVIYADPGCGKSEQHFNLLGKVRNCDVKRFLVSVVASESIGQLPNPKPSIGDIVGILGLVAAAPAGLVAVLVLLKYFRPSMVLRSGQRSLQCKSIRF